MQDLEPPEVPLDMVPQATSQDVPQTGVGEQKKKGFLKNLFSGKSKSTIAKSEGEKLQASDLPSLNLSPPETDGNELDNNDNVSGLPVMPSVKSQFEEFKSDLELLESGKIANKSRGKLKKGQKRNLNKLDESSKFDWDREVKDQEILIHDSNRFNQDVNLLITKADEHIENQTSFAKSDAFVSEHQELQHSPESIDIEEPNINLTRPIPENNQQMPIVDEEQSRAFMKISMSHKRLKSTLEKYLRNKKLFNDKAKMLALFKLYDENVEKKIEDKELELTKRKNELENFERHLKVQEKEILNTHSYIKGLDTKLEDRESNINDLIAKTAEKELSRRLRIDKKALLEELNKTKALNIDLKKKTRIIEDDRIRFESEHQKMSELERKKLNELQAMYEKKLQELDADRKAFDDEKKNFMEKRKNSLALIARSDAVSRDLEDIRKTKEYIDSSKTFIEGEITEDKELKSAIEKAENSLVHEKENVDNIIFEKYLNNRLKNIRPEYLQTRENWNNALRSNPLFEQISHCRRLLTQHNFIGAKKLYNDIRMAYDMVKAPRKEKEALYTAIRELYNDIQLRFVETQIHTS